MPTYTPSHTYVPLIWDQSKYVLWKSQTTTVQTNIQTRDNIEKLVFYIDPAEDLKILYYYFFHPLNRESSPGPQRWRQHENRCTDYSTTESAKKCMELRNQHVDVLVVTVSLHFIFYEYIKYVSFFIRDRQRFHSTRC